MWQRNCWKLCAMVLCSLFILSLAGYRQMFSEASEPDSLLRDLQNLDELRTRFNQDKGMPRIVLLLSPT